MHCTRNAGLLLLLCACQHTGPSAADGGKGQPAAADKVVRVESAVVSEGDVPQTMTLTGTLEADQRTELAANAAGRVIRTFVERGDHVKAGALLAQLDARGAALSRAEAEANAQQIGEQLKAVRLECERYAALRDKGAITQQEYDQQATQCRTQASSEEAARTRLAEATRVLTDAAIRAPFAGVIAERFISVGDYVQPSSKVVTLLVDDPLRVRISVPESAVRFAREGTRVTFEVLTLPDREFSATIQYVGREVRPSTRDVIDEAVADNHDRLLLPGAFVTVKLPVGTARQVIVPKRAIATVDESPTVFVVHDGRLEQRAVHTTLNVDDGVAVSEGLQKGERVVLNPAPGLQDGARVQ